MLEVAGALRDLARALEQRRWPWYVFGAQAVLAHGSPRLTADIDVTIDALGARGKEVLLVLGDARFEVRARGFEEALAEARLLPMVHAPSGIPVDVVLAGDGIEKEFLARAVPASLGGVLVPVLCVEDLLVTKALAGRRKDKEDVLGILATSLARVDLARVRAILKRVDDSLDAPRAQKAFERLFAAHERRQKRRG